MNLLGIRVFQLEPKCETDSGSSSCAPRCPKAHSIQHAIEQIHGLSGTVQSFPPRRRRRDRQPLAPPPTNDRCLHRCSGRSKSTLSRWRAAADLASEAELCQDPRSRRSLDVTCQVSGRSVHPYHLMRCGSASHGCLPVRA